MIKRIARLILAILYIGALVLCIPVIIKPGASIFYFKKTIDNRSIKPDTGFAYFVEPKLDPAIFRSQGILLYEDGHLLDRADYFSVANQGRSTYALGKSAQGSLFIYFASADNSSPLTNGKKYTLYIPFNLVTRPNGIVCLAILLAGLAGFLFFSLANSDRRKIFAKSPAGFLIILDAFFDRFTRLTGSDNGPAGELIKARAAIWKRLFTATVLAAFFYIFMEWLFIVTMPSFMSLLSLFEKMEVFAIGGLAFSLLCLLGLAVYITADLFVTVVGLSTLTRYLGALIPAAVLSGLALLLIDNFTYTLFKFGISTSAGVWRGVYALLFTVLFILIFMRMHKYLGIGKTARPQGRPSSRLFYFALGLLVVSGLLALTRLDLKKLASPDTPAGAPQASRRPNILLLASDGMSADHMSVYGYTRDTTPTLRALVQSSLMAENAFPNAGSTAASVASLLTSKLPTQIRIMYPPNILTGINAYQHLPGILKNQGYQTVEFGSPYFVDAYTYNFQAGFDMVNDRTQGGGGLSSLGLKLGLGNVGYFLENAYGRISDRILHIFLIREMQNPYSIVTQPVKTISDGDKLKQTLDLIDHSNVPIFIHVHLMGTHGPKYAPKTQKFSAGQVQDQDWMVDFYDDTLLAYDQYVNQVIEHLKANGEYDNTILIVSTDHNLKYHAYERIPLIIHFPQDAYAGRITGNVENMDIAPTLLDYLGVPAPAWMDGTSLLKGQPDSQRLIFGMSLNGQTLDKIDRHNINADQVKPPFYQFGSIDVVNCQKWYFLNLENLHWTSGDIPGHTSPCTPDRLLTQEQIKQAIIQRLTLDGFDTSSIH